MTNDVARLLEQLRSPKRQEREAAAHGLAGTGARRAVPALIEVLKSDKYTRVREAAAAALGSIGDRRAIPHLAQALRDKRIKVSSAASVALSLIGKPAVPTLIEALEDDQASVRERAARALGQIRDRRTFSALVQALEDKSASVRTQAVWSLQKLGDRRAIPHLLACLQRQSDSTYWAAKLLGRWGVIEELEEGLSDGRWWVRAAAVTGLGEAKEADVALFERALEDPSKEVRKRAVDALRKKGRDVALQEDRTPSRLVPVTLGAKPSSPPLASPSQVSDVPAGERGIRIRRLLPGHSAMTWIDDLLERDANVLLTPTWIAQAQKTTSQKRLMTAERDTLWAMARELMTELWMALDDEVAREWASTALALLNELPGSGAIGERVKLVMQDPASTPRGHYEEGMHGYFRGIQFLQKSVFDVRLDAGWCQHMQHYVFPWSALPPLLGTLRNHPKLRQRWEDLHHFYTVFTGVPDCVCIGHLLLEDRVTEDTVANLARSLGVPKINQKMGLGVQGLGERFTHHGVQFERLKETFLPDISTQPIPRESVYAAVNMRSLLYGFEHLDGQIPGLQCGHLRDGLSQALAPLRKKRVTSFFDQFLLAQYELIADLPVPQVTALAPQVDPAVERMDPGDRRRLNAFAANLASLLEFAILSAKQPVKVVALGIAPPPRSRVYVERAPRAFFARLRQAAQTVADLCAQTKDRYGVSPPADPPGLTRADILMRSLERDTFPEDYGAIYRVLGELSESGESIPKASREWYTMAPLVERLRRNPNVTADAYRHVHGGLQYFLQWCTAMAAFSGRVADGMPVEGAELLFVEEWNDRIVPGRKEPLTNSSWREVLKTMDLDDLRGWTIAPV